MPITSNENSTKYIFSQLVHCTVAALVVSTICGSFGNTITNITTKAIINQLCIYSNWHICMLW